MKRGECPTEEVSLSPILEVNTVSKGRGGKERKRAKRTGWEKAQRQGSVNEIQGVKMIGHVKKYTEVALVKKYIARKKKLEKEARVCGF